MRLKTFFTSYFLLIFILFITVSTISVYMINNQMDMLNARSGREYQTISASLARDLAATLDRSHNDTLESIMVSSLVNAYASFYNEHFIEISLIDLQSNDDVNPYIETSFTVQEERNFVFISGVLPTPFQNYRLEAFFDMTDDLASMKQIKQMLLILFIMFSIVAAVALHLILIKIFKPLEIVAVASKKIAGGEYSERILIKGEKNELSAVAEDFNTMAEEIEKQIKRLRKEVEGKQQFVDNFAHEIRTPLTSVNGYAEYMQKVYLKEDELIEATQYIMDEAKHMKNLANSLLELATLRNFIPQKVMISIPQLFEDIGQTLKKTFDEQKIKLMCHTDVDFLEAQQDLLKSLLLNLCFNALKACSHGEGVIKLEAKKEKEKIILSVSDNGCGIPKESLEKVTEPFFRVDKARSREGGSTGLGLTLCGQIAQVFDAQMIIESEEEVGTEVKIVFTAL